MKNTLSSDLVLALFMSFWAGNIVAQCPNQLTNQSTSITLSPGYLRSGADGATGVQIGSVCGLRIHSDAGAQWGRYEIPINVTNNGLVSGDQIEISMDITNVIANFHYDVTGGSTILDVAPTAPISGRIITVPSGVTTILIRLFTNHDQADVGGSFDVSNLSVSKVGTGGNENEAPSIPSNVSAVDNGNGTATINWTGSTDTDGISNYKVFADENADGGYVEIGTSTSTSFTSGTLNTSQYRFTVSAVDNSSENLESDPSVASNTITITNGGGSSGTSVWTESNTTASYTGEVAIGRSSVPANYKLAVEGSIRAREIRVDTESWPDYVFQEGYELPSLEEIQKHIQEKGHLPNIPSAREVEANGIALGEMDRLLLQKIEELTLFTIEQSHQIQSLKEEIKNLQTQKR